MGIMRLYSGDEEKNIMFKKNLKISKRTVDSLVSSMDKLAKGDMNVRINEGADDGAGDLIKAFNQMGEHLQKRMMPVRKFNKVVNDRKRIAAALKESEQKFSEIVDNINDVFFQLSTRGVFQYVSPAAEKLFGYDTEKIIGNHIRKTTPTGELVKILEIIRKVSEGKTIEGLELNQINAKGVIVHTEINAVPLKRGEKIVAIVGIMRNISERKKSEIRLQAAYDKLKSTQSQLIQAEKLKVVGAMASGVAHEVKNPLGIIMQAVNFLEAEVSSSNNEQFLSVINMIKEAIKRADNIICGMLDFSRPAPLKLKPDDLNAVIHRSLGLINKQMTLKSTKTSLRLEENLPQVIIDSNQMQQVFINIMLNALQAMPNGGQLFLRTFTKKLTENEGIVGRRKTDLFSAGDTVVVCESEDTGQGIPKDKLDKIFDPFFTTKPPGQGTGLGLAIIRTIIEKHRGIINIESEEGKGTKVTVMLPVAHA